MRKSNVDMLNGPIVKGLLSLAVPIMIMNLLQSMFNIIDMTVLKMYADDMSVGAIGVCGSLTVLATTFLAGLSTGANIVVARRIGEKNKDAADKAAMTSILLAIVSGLLFMVIGVVFAEFFLKLTKCPSALLPEATVYFKLYFCSVPILMVYNFCASILRAIGDTKRPMYFLTIGGIIKVLFTFLFVCHLDMEVKGVGIATIISTLVACVLVLIKVVKFQDVVDIDFKKLKFTITELKSIMFIGVPAGIQGALYCFANVVITTAVNSYGEYATTGISIANQFDGILYQIALAPSYAVAPYVAQNIGAGNLKRVKQTVVRAILITIAFAASLGSLSAIFSGQLSSIMSSNPAVIAYSQEKMIIVSSTYFICGINEVFCGVLRGMGKPIIPTISSLIFLCLLRFVWVYFIFPLCPNFTFLYTVWPVGWTLSIVTLFTAYVASMSKLKRQSVYSS